MYEVEEGHRERLRGLDESVVSLLWKAAKPTNVCIAYLFFKNDFEWSTMMPVVSRKK